MGWFTGCVLYALIWWVVLFTVLPFGMQTQSDPDPVTGWRGAPERPRMLRKVLMTSLIAGVVWVVCAGLISSPYLSFRSGWLAMPSDP